MQSVTLLLVRLAKRISKGSVRVHCPWSSTISDGMDGVTVVVPGESVAKTEWLAVLVLDSL